MLTTLLSGLFKTRRKVQISRSYAHSSQYASLACGFDLSALRRPFPDH